MAHGPIDVARFMTLALSDRQEGYYRNQDPLGRKGDFTTAPEISQIFGELIGAALAQAWLDLGRPVPFTFGELGPGRGTLAADALRATRKLPGWLDGMEVHLIESNLALRRQQDRKLASFNPQFHDHVASLPTNRPLIGVANEFFDCLPIHQFQRTNRGWQERLIALDDQGQFAFTLDPRSIELAEYSQHPPGTIIETAPAREALASQLAQHIAQTGGFLLIVDYGDDVDERGDSFQAVRAHQKSDPLRNIGTSDLTSHVLFRPLATAAIKAGCHAFGPVSQQDYLSRLGAHDRLEHLSKHATVAQRETLAGGLERLLDPQGMGTLFKVMAITSLSSAPGFLPQEAVNLAREFCET